MDFLVVAEAHFISERNNERFNKLEEKYNAELMQIHCSCEVETLRKRFKERMKKESYHKGYLHTISLYGEDRIMNSLANTNRTRLEINGATYDLDTTNPERIDYDKLFDFIYSNWN